MAAASCAAAVPGAATSDLRRTPPPPPPPPSIPTAAEGCHRTSTQPLVPAPSLSFPCWLADVSPEAPSVMSFAALPFKAKGPQPLTRVALQRADHSSEGAQKRADQQRQERVTFTQQKREQVMTVARQKPKAAAALSDSPRSGTGDGEKDRGKSSVSGDSDSCDSSEGESDDEASDEEDDSSGSSSEDESSPSVPAHLSSPALARYTSRPSPVVIPRNSIGLTYLHSFLSTAECSQLVELGQGCFSRSTTSLGITHHRTSHSASLSPIHPLIKEVRARVAELTGARDGQIEPLKVVRYMPGQQYKPHYDSSGDDTYPRSHTIFAYLNDVPEGGGETEFTLLGVKFKPKQGDALFWENQSDRCSYHKDGKHAGRPPLVGVKYGLNIWIEFAAVSH